MHCLASLAPLTQGEAPYKRRVVKNGGKYIPLQSFRGFEGASWASPARWSPGEKQILCISIVTEHFCLQDIANVSEMQIYDI